MMERAFPHRRIAPRLWARGFLSQRGQLYPFERFDRRLFLTDVDIEHRLRHVNDIASREVLQNKLVFHLALRSTSLSANLPTLVGMVTAGRFTPLAEDGCLAAAIERHGALVCKPAMGQGGQGVSVLRSPELPVSPGVLIVESRIVQHGYAATIFPDALNTIRVVTLTDRGGVPFVAAAVHRFGWRGSAPVDNFKKGGIAALVDLQTGCLSAGRSNPGTHAATLHRRHPDTGAIIEGTTVPHWREVIRLALDLASLFPGLHHVGWDLCVTDKGVCVIEGNGRLANPNLVQAHRPFLADARVRDFMVRHRVISPARATVLERL